MFINYVQLANTRSQFCSSKGKNLTLMLHELLMITVESQVTFPLNLTMAFVEILDILAHVSALLTFDKKFILKLEIKFILLANFIKNFTQ